MKLAIVNRMEGPQWTPAKEGCITRTGGKYWLFEKSKWRHLPYEELVRRSLYKEEYEAFDRAMKQF